MPRSGEDARRRLQVAALKLFADRGYDAVTAAEIAARAGVTERTFFRHFADKREVLFHGEEAFCADLHQAVLAAPTGYDPMGAVLWAFSAVGRQVETNRAFAEPRQKVIAETPALQERMLAKTAALTAALTDALSRRGVEPHIARLAAQAGMAAFAHAASAWSRDPDKSVEVHLEKAFEALQDLTSAMRDNKSGA